MRQLLTRLCGGWLQRSYRRRVELALKLQLRGEARADGLELERTESHLKVVWRARGIHPWDREHLDGEGRDDLFVKQALADADAALSRLFTLLPHLDCIELSVVDPDTHQVIMRGAVTRAGIAAPRPLSNRIWLGQLGVRFRLRGNRFEPLEFTNGELSGTA